MSDRLDIGLSDEVPTGLVLKYGDDFHGNGPYGCRQSAARVREEVDFSGEGRSYRDLAADAEKLNVEPFFLQVAFLLRDDETEHGSAHRRIGDADIFDGARRINREERNYQADERESRNSFIAHKSSFPRTANDVIYLLSLPVIRSQRQNLPTGPKTEQITAYLTRWSWTVKWRPCSVNVVVVGGQEVPL